ncbi:MAG: hypothetical protein ACLT3D_03350 [Lawsonibacter sp.]
MTPTLAPTGAEAIRRFVPQEFWTVTASCLVHRHPADPNGCQARLLTGAGGGAGCPAGGKGGGDLQGAGLQVVQRPRRAYDPTEPSGTPTRRCLPAKETLAILQNLYEIHKVVTTPAPPAISPTTWFPPFRSGCAA